MSSLSFDPFGIAEFHRCDEVAARCPLRAAGVGFTGGDGSGLRCLGTEGRGAAADRLRRYLSRSEDVGALRRIASAGDVMSAQLSDEQILEQVAAMVERREVCLLAPMVNRSGEFSISDGPRRSEAVRPVATGLTPSRHLPRAPEPPVAPAAAPADALETVDPTQQVAVLEDAARDGVPFCAVCEKAKA